MWREKRMTRRVCMTIIVVAASLLMNGCGKFIYSVRGANYGEYGIILREFPTVGLKRLRYLEPGIPGVRDDVANFNNFIGHPDSLPDQIEVEWQLAELKECSHVASSKSLVYGTTDQKTYTSKIGCTWIPLEDKIYRKVIDLKAIQESEHAKRSGETISLGQTRVLNILFMFRDEELEISFGSHVHNAWR